MKRLVIACAAVLAGCGADFTANQTDGGATADSGASIRSDAGGTQDGGAADAGRVDAGRADAGTPCQKSVLLYPDADGDGFGSKLATATLECPWAPGFAGNNMDCADGDARANPLQAAWQTTPITGPTSSGLPWDFDCDGQEQLEKPAHGLCTALNGGCYNSPGQMSFWNSEKPPACGELRAFVLECRTIPTQGVCVNGSSQQTVRCR